MIGFTNQKNLMNLMKISIMKSEIVVLRLHIRDLNVDYIEKIKGLIKALFYLLLQEKKIMNLSVNYFIRPP